MRAAVLSLGALALGLATAHEYPYCEKDNCYRNMIDERFADQIEAWCPEFLSGTTTAPSAIHTALDNCDGNVRAVSSACSCITYWASTTTEAPTSSTSSSGVESTTEAPETTTSASESSSTATSTTTEDDEDDDCTETDYPTSTPTSTTKWTTSTITTSTTKTITKCPPTVTSCPAGSTTVTTEIITTVTVCPVTETPTLLPTTSVPPTSSFGTVTRPPTTGGPNPTTSVPVTAGAGRVVRGVEGIAAIAGLFAALL
ncbi:hypothetical protein MFIFM68171_09409 [Madurella fahalii]|uniref:Uncharacterized protein n=1 Tax=Madurella fahalii TaxID=1157608 RepID=A0ABQ0GND6_9PEZI